MYISCCASRYVCHTHNDQWARMKVCVVVCARTQTTTHTRSFELPQLPQLSRRPHSTEMWSISLAHTHTHTLTNTLEFHLHTSRLGCRRHHAVLFINICHHTRRSTLIRKASPALQKLFIKSTLPFSAVITLCSAILPAASFYTTQQGYQFNRLCCSRVATKGCVRLSIGLTEQ